MIFETTSDDEWTVDFEGDFWRNFGWGSKRIPIHQSFRYCDTTCLVPYIYLCPEGVVIDYCVGVKPEKIQTFLDKWNFSVRSNWDEFTPEEIEAIENEHPLRLHFDVDHIIINHGTLRKAHECSISYMPASCQPDVYKNQEAELEYIRRYGLDVNMGWVICRSSYSWDRARTNVSISDCAEGDSLRAKENSHTKGGAVGVAVLVRNDKDINCRSVCSSMHFEPVEHMEWRMTFSEKPAEDAVIKLI